jgi:hypothetical protein
MTPARVATNSYRGAIPVVNRRFWDQRRRTMTPQRPRSVRTAAGMEALRVACIAPPDDRDAVVPIGGPSSDGGSTEGRRAMFRTRQPEQAPDLRPSAQVAQDRPWTGIPRMSATRWTSSGP